MNGRAYLTIPETADELRVSRASVYRLINRGELEAIRVGYMLRVARVALDAFQTRQKVAS